MKPQKFLCALIFTFILAGESYPAQKNAPNNRARNIYQLFMRVNPRLAEESAKKYAQIIIEAAEKFKQDPYVIAGIVVHESTVNNKAVSKGGDYGLMQVRWKVHEKAIKQRFPKVKRANDMFDARTNIFFGTEIFRDCMRKSDGDFRKGLMYYSAGNTKLRDKVTATVNDLRAKDSSKNANTVKAKSAQPNTAKVDSVKPNSAQANNTQAHNAQDNKINDNGAKVDSAKANTQKSKRHQTEAEMVISTLLRQSQKKEK